MLKCKLGQFSVTILRFFKFSVTIFAREPPFSVTNFVALCYHFALVYLIYNQKNIFIYFLLLYKIELKMNSKSYAYARVARTREGKRNFVYSQ